MPNWKQTRFCSFRAFLLRLFLKLNFRYWAKRTDIDMPSLRAREDRLAAYMPKPPRHVEIVDLQIDGVTAHRVSPPGVSPDRVILYLHGGGYIAGSPSSSHRDFIWRLAEYCGVTVIALDYRKAPEAPFPAALEDAEITYHALLKEHAAESIAVAGDSAGGGLALALVHKLRDEGVALPAALVVLSPWADLNNTGDSITRNMATERMVPAHLLDELAAFYIGTHDPENPYLSPLYGDFTGFPASLLLASDSEALCDDAIRVADKMKAAGVPVVLQLWTKLPHAWPVLARFVPESRAALKQVAMFLQGHLRG